MQIVFNTDKNALIVTLDGDLDHHTATQMREKIDESIICHNATTLIFSLANLSFMDSSGIGIIMGRYKLMKERGGTVSITGIRPQIKKLIDMSGLRKIVPEYPTVQDAMNHSENLALKGGSAK